MQPGFLERFWPVTGTFTRMKGDATVHSEFFAVEGHGPFNFTFSFRSRRRHVPYRDS